MADNILLPSRGSTSAISGIGVVATLTSGQIDFAVQGYVAP